MLFLRTTKSGRWAKERVDALMKSRRYVLADSPATFQFRHLSIEGLKDSSNIFIVAFYSLTFCTTGILLRQAGKEFHNTWEL